VPRTLATVPRPDRLLSLSVVVLLLASTSAFGQGEGSRRSQPGSGSVGGSIFWDLSGDYERLGSKDGTVGPLWLVYGSVFVTPRIAIGAEYSTLGTIDTSVSNPIIGDNRYLSKSAGLYGVARVRVVRRTQVSLDLLGGVGGQFSHREFHYTPVGGANPYNSSDSVNYLSYLAGAEMPIAVARHIDVSPYARFYFLRGLPHQPTESASWQTGIGAGMTVAFKW
jgi:hypothetical protein